MPYCTHCGHDNPDGSNFCANCGRPLNRPTGPAQPESAFADGDTTKTIPAIPDEADERGLSAEDEAAVKALPQGSALLIVERGSNAGSRFLLNTDRVDAGRSPDSDIFLDDISVSRKHVVFVRTDEGVIVRDVGSLNGTYVNRETVDERLLHDGDEVQIGKFRLVFYAGDPS